jgi:hypothetical protein
MIKPQTGGCQCGAVRFRADALGRASICYCRMCQKASGGIGGLLVRAQGLSWTRGALKHFASSNVVRRGFCGDCGTPLTFEYESGIEISIAALDRPAEIAPTIQLAKHAMLPWVPALLDLPTRAPDEQARMAPYYVAVRSNQHPDCDTDVWPSTRVGA